MVNLKILGLFGVLLLLVGCAGPQMTPEEREYVENERAIKWETCKRLYKAVDRPWISTHAHIHKKHRDWDVRDDLRLNNCDHLLCQAQMWECRNENK